MQRAVVQDRAQSTLLNPAAAPAHLSWAAAAWPAPVAASVRSATAEPQASWLPDEHYLSELAAANNKLQQRPLPGARSRLRGKCRYRLLMQRRCQPEGKLKGHPSTPPRYHLPSLLHAGGATFHPVHPSCPLLPLCETYGALPHAAPCRWRCCLACLSPSLRLPLSPSCHCCCCPCCPCCLPSLLPCPCRPAAAPPTGPSRHWPPPPPCASHSWSPCPLARIMQACRLRQWLWVLGASNACWTTRMSCAAGLCRCGGAAHKYTCCTCH